MNLWAGNWGATSNHDMVVQASFLYLCRKYIIHVLGRTIQLCACMNDVDKAFAEIKNFFWLLKLFPAFITWLGVGIPSTLAPLLLIVSTSWLQQTCLCFQEVWVWVCFFRFLLIAPVMSLCSSYYLLGYKCLLSQLYHWESGLMLLCQFLDHCYSS